MGGEIPKSIKDAPVRIDVGGQQPTFDDLLMLLEDRGLSVVMGWDDGTHLGTSSASQTYKVSQETSPGEEDADGSKKSEVEVKREMTDSGASAEDRKSTSLNSSH